MFGGRDVPEGLSRRAGAFVRCNGVWIPDDLVPDWRERFVEVGIPAAVVERVVAYQRRWGGLVLPPSVVYDGGPMPLSIDIPVSDDDRWCFEAGRSRSALPYGFCVGPDDAFGLRLSPDWVPLHASIEGWVESLALTHAATRNAGKISRLTPDELDRLDRSGFEPIRETIGIVDTWWRDESRLLAVHAGEARLWGRRYLTAYLYSEIRHFDHL